MEQPELKPWHTVLPGEWAFGADMPARIKYEQIKLSREFGDRVSFGFQNGERYINIESECKEEGNIVMWLNDVFPMAPPAINSIKIGGHGLWQPATRLVAVVLKEYDMRALEYTDDVGDDWCDDAFDSALIGVADEVVG
jgi:hypothetical protein